MTASSRDPWLTHRPRSGPTTQVCNQPPRPASLAGNPPVRQPRRPQPAKRPTRSHPAVLSGCRLNPTPIAIQATFEQASGWSGRRTQGC